jgi:hypothetical protein
MSLTRFYFRSDFCCGLVDEVEVCRGAGVWRLPLLQIEVAAIHLDATAVTCMHWGRLSRDLNLRPSVVILAACYITSRHPKCPTQQHYSVLT